MGRYVVSVDGMIAGQRVANILGVQSQAAGPGDEAEATAVARRVAESWKARLLPQQSAAYSLSGATARGLDTPGLIGVHQTTGVGARAQQSLPAFVVAKVQLLTSQPGRAGTGRTGISGVGEDFNDGTATINQMGTAYASGLVTAMQALRTDLTATDLYGAQGAFALVVISRFLNKTKRATPETYVVQGFKVPLGFGSRNTRKG